MMRPLVRRTSTLFRILSRLRARRSGNSTAGSSDRLPYQHILERHRTMPVPCAAEWRASVTCSDGQGGNQ